MARYTLLQKLGLARLPVGTEVERRARRRLFLMVGLIVAGAGVMLIGLVVFRQRWMVAFAPLLWLGAMGCAFQTTRIANANYDGKKHLERIGFKVCPDCEYDLSAHADQGRCPECGGEYEPETLKARWRDIYTKLEEKAGR